MIRTYSELIRLSTLEERYEYLKLRGKVGIETFGFDRFLNQHFYKSNEWLSVRNRVILRDDGCDLGVYGYDIPDTILVHHMNPICREDFLSLKTKDAILDPEYLICTAKRTHNGIHYGGKLQLCVLVDRRPGDTCPWKK